MARYSYTTVYSYSPFALALLLFAWYEGHERIAQKGQTCRQDSHLWIGLQAAAR